MQTVQKRKQQQKQQCKQQELQPKQPRLTYKEVLQKMQAHKCVQINSQSQQPNKMDFSRNKYGDVIIKTISTHLVIRNYNPNEKVIIITKYVIEDLIMDENIKYDFHLVYKNRDGFSRYINTSILTSSIRPPHIFTRHDNSLKIKRASIVLSVIDNDDVNGQKKTIGYIFVKDVNKKKFHCHQDHPIAMKKAYIRHHVKLEKKQE